MSRMFRVACDFVRPRALVLVMCALAAGAGCSTDSSSPAALNDGDDTGAAAPVGSSPLASVTYTGLPYGPVALWDGNKPKFGPQPFTASTNSVNADTVILQINAARTKGQRLVLAMAGVKSTQLVTNGAFDLAKWKSLMNTYNKTAIKNAVAAAVADGTVIGNQVIDEPEKAKTWGTAINKTTIDQMAAYAKSMFPTLPMGVNHGPPGYNWHSEQKYTKVDYVRYLYAWYVTSGDIAKWRLAVLARAKLDGVTPALAINVINGGPPDKGDGSYDCAGATQGDPGGSYPLCTMTPDQIVTYGKALMPYGCFLMMWQFDKTVFSKSANLTAFKTLATAAAATAKRSCRRP